MHGEFHVVAADDSGGETACWAHFVCAECGAIVSEEPHAHDPDTVPPR